MGRTYTAECIECNRVYNFDVGIGSAYSKDILTDYNSEFNIFTLFKEKKRKEELMNILKSNNFTLLDDYGHRMMICDTCKNIYSRFKFSIIYDNQKVFNPLFRCHTCKRKLRELSDEEILNGISKCPHCNNEMKFHYSCDWN